MPPDNLAMKRQESEPVHPEVRIGQAHLKVADLERSPGFHRDVPGFEVTQRLGQPAAFLSAGGCQHHIGRNTWESRGGSPPHRGATGLYHVAIVHPTRGELADAVRRPAKAGVSLEGASDPGVSEALYVPAYKSANKNPHQWMLAHPEPAAKGKASEKR